jgi:hypothetical protein
MVPTCPTATVDSTVGKKFLAQDAGLLWDEQGHRVWMEDAKQHRLRPETVLAFCEAYALEWLVLFQ